MKTIFPRNTAGELLKVLALAFRHRPRCAGRVSEPERCPPRLARQLSGSKETEVGRPAHARCPGRRSSYVRCCDSNILKWHYQKVQLIAFTTLSNPLS